MSVHLDDTSSCPLGVRCESCGTEAGDLAVATASTLLGAMCLTLCERCAGSGVLPNVSLPTACRLALQHCEHLGIDADVMADALRAEDAEPQR